MNSCVSIWVSCDSLSEYNLVFNLDVALKIFYSPCCLSREHIYYYESFLCFTMLLVDFSWCYPFTDRDPFLIENSPHVYFAENQDRYETRRIKGISLRFDWPLNWNWFLSVALNDDRIIYRIWRVDRTTYLHPWILWDRSCSYGKLYCDLYEYMITKYFLRVSTFQTKTHFVNNNSWFMYSFRVFGRPAIS